jgi:hypothetical protein
MKNCFLKQYKKSVNNNELLELGELRFQVINQTDFYMKSAERAELTGLDGVLINGSADAYVDSIGINGVGGNATISGITEGGMGLMSVIPKYNIIQVNLKLAGTVDVVDWGKIPSLKTLRLLQSDAEIYLGGISDVTAILEKLTVTKFTHFSVEDLMPFKDTLNDLQMPTSDGNNTYFVDSFDNFGHLYKLSAINFFSALVNCYGTVEGFVANRLIEQPATAGSISVKYLGIGGRVTYQGEPIASKENNTIAWDAQGNITLS